MRNKAVHNGTYPHPAQARENIVEIGRIIRECDDALAANGCVNAKGYLAASFEEDAFPEMESLRRSMRSPGLHFHGSWLNLVLDPEYKEAGERADIEARIEDYASGRVPVVR